MSEKRRGYIRGMPPSTLLAFCIAISSVIGTWFVMQDNISDNADAIKEVKEVIGDSNTRMWNRINNHNH